MCSHCGAAFKIISHLKDHTLKHTGEKPKQCSLCPSAYTRTSHLKRHVLRAHPGCDPLTATQSVWTAKETPTRWDPLTATQSVWTAKETPTSWSPLTATQSVWTAKETPTRWDPLTATQSVWTAKETAVQALVAPSAMQRSALLGPRGSKEREDATAEVGL